jgi:YD repeat-containing protein
VANLTSTSSSNPHGASMSYSFDSLNRLTTVFNNGIGGSGPIRRPIPTTRPAISNLVTVTDPNRVQATFTYDTPNRLTGAVVAGEHRCRAPRTTDDSSPLGFVRSLRSKIRKLLIVLKLE